MIIVVAALEFANQSDRDKAVALVADVQRLTREEEPGCHDYCFAPDPAVRGDEARPCAACLPGAGWQCVGCSALFVFGRNGSRKAFEVAGHVSDGPYRASGLAGNRLIMTGLHQHVAKE